MSHSDHAQRLREIASCPLCLQSTDKTALLAGAAALERARWRPISEAHEDLGEVILIDISDPGMNCIAHVNDLDWDEKSEGMTHFAQAPLLTEEMVNDLEDTHEKD